MSIEIGSSDPYAESDKGIIYLGAQADQEIIVDIIEHETLHLIVNRIALGELESIPGDMVDHEILNLLMRGQLEYRDAEVAYDFIRENYYKSTKARV